jgi:hypothetical protein
LKENRIHPIQKSAVFFRSPRNQILIFKMFKSNALFLSLKRNSPEKFARKRKVKNLAEACANAESLMVFSKQTSLKIRQQQGHGGCDGGVCLRLGFARRDGTCAALGFVLVSHDLVMRLMNAGVGWRINAWRGCFASERPREREVEIVKAAAAEAAALILLSTRRANNIAGGARPIKIT